MKSYTALRTLYGKITKNTSVANLSLGDEVIMDEYRHLCALKDFAFLHRARTLTTQASVQFRALPYDIDQVESVSVTVSSKIYTPKLMHSREEWDILNQVSFTSDFPEKAFVYNGQLGLWPTPATSANVITVNGKVRPVELNTADITSSTITTLANGGTALTVSGGLTVQMAGFWIRPTYSTTANTGDGQWYEISGVTNATTGTLVRGYGGVSISAGTAPSTIAQMPLLPETFHDTPVWKAASDYWYKEGDVNRGKTYEGKYDRDVKDLVSQYSSYVTDPVLQEGLFEEPIINPNLTVQL